MRLLRVAVGGCASGSARGDRWWSGAWRNTESEGRLGIAAYRLGSAARRMPPHEPIRSFWVHSYGCQMNKLDGELVASKLVAAGFAPAASEEAASVVLLNTCTVRQHAEDRVWSKLGVLRQRKRREPGLVVGVLGCMAQEHRRFLLARMPHVDLVVGPSAFGDIAGKVDAARARNLDLQREAAPPGRAHLRGAGVVAVDDGVSGDRIVREVGVRPHRSQAYVSIMRGCNMPCTYCIVPTTRGAEVSRTVAEIVEET